MSSTRDALVSLEALVTELRQAWLERRYDALERLFSPRVVMLAPAFAARVEGRDTLIASYREFMERSTITRFDEQLVSIDMWEDTAVTHTTWHMQWSTHGTANDERGGEMLVLRRASEALRGWEIVTRIMLPAATPPAAA